MNLPVHACDLPPVPANYGCVTCSECGKVWRVDRTRNIWMAGGPVDLAGIRSRAGRFDSSYPQTVLPETDYLDLIEEVRSLRAHVHEHLGGVIRHSHDGAIHEVADGS